MNRDVRFSQAAFRHVDAADSWWRENRPAAPDLFLSELRRALSVVQGAPDSFAVLDEPRMPGLRRILLEKSRYHLYWTTTDDAPSANDCETKVRPEIRLRGARLADR